MQCAFMNHFKRRLYSFDTMWLGFRGLTPKWLAWTIFFQRLQFLCFEKKHLIPSHVDRLVKLKILQKTDSFLKVGEGWKLKAWKLAEGMKAQNWRLKAEIKIWRLDLENSRMIQKKSVQCLLKLSTFHSPPKRVSLSGMP